MPCIPNDKLKLSTRAEIFLDPMNKELEGLDISTFFEKSKLKMKKRFGVMNQNILPNCFTTNRRLNPFNAIYISKLILIT
jgi:hypothetical protein